ncbi:hypothetical protein [Flavihumibacter profundi]|uniref:hypothetical protein n=1 Tax=Flavihumibacter profundi TaxID=2716883 RepID=UPI001CC7C25F|nr:hypothetical protein [Flavihumibacter profundi]MBZ5857764.1 hypothetical protein [Flavihumibacter profundi]
MGDYKEPLIYADEILKFIEKGNGSIPFVGGYSIMEDDRFTPSLIRLKADGFLFEETKSGYKNLTLTKEGREVLQMGGYNELLKRDEERKNNVKVKQELELEKLRYDVKNSKRIYKTYWWTFAFSITALVISLILLYLKLSE